MAGLNLSTGNIEVKAQSTANAAGTNLTLKAGQGTGTGAGGSIVFQVAHQHKYFTKGTQHASSVAIAQMLRGGQPKNLTAGADETVTALGTYSGSTVAADTVLYLVDDNNNECIIQLEDALESGDSQLDLKSNSNASAASGQSVMNSSMVTTVYSATAASLVTTDANSLATAMEIDENFKVTINGDLQVKGETVTIDSSVTTIEDPLMVLGAGNTGSTDLGIIMIRSGSSNQWMGFDESDDYFKVANVGSEAGTTVGNLSISSIGDMMVGKLAIESSSDYIDINSSNLTAVAAGDFVADAVGNIVLDADGDTISMKAGSTDSTGLRFTQSGSGDWTVKTGQTDKDLIFAEDGGTEIMRVDSSAESLHMNDNKRIEFGDTGEYIYGSGTDLFIASSAELDITAVTLDIESTGALTVDSAGAASHIKHTATANGDFTVAMDASVDASLILSSAGTGADALQITASAGGIDISASGAADGEDIDITATGSSVNVTSTQASVRDAVKIVSSGAASGIQLQVADADGIAIMGNASADTYVRVVANSTAGSELVQIVNADGTDAAAVAVTSSAGGITLSVASTSQVTCAGHFLPSGTVNLGSDSARWNFVYAGDVDLTNDRGSWTLIEEDSFISFRNNKTGRRFKMIMEDITGTGTYGPGNDGVM